MEKNTKNKVINAYNEYVMDLGADIPLAQAKSNAGRKKALVSLLMASVCVFAIFLLLWTLFPSVVKIPFLQSRDTQEAPPRNETTSAADDTQSGECQVWMTVQINGVVMEEGETYSVRPGDKIEINAYSSEAEIERIGYYSSVNMSIRDTFDNDAYIILPEYEGGTRIQLFIEAVATNDDGSANTITKTGWKKYYLEY